jgi:hypothetical protein
VLSSGKDSSCLKKLVVLRILCICLTGLFSAIAADAQETPKFEVGPVVSYAHVFQSPPIGFICVVALFFELLGLLSHLR